MSVLAVDGVSVMYGQRAVLTDVSFELARGEMLALVGRNGSGKSSLLRVLSGVLAPVRGSVRWLGRSELPVGKARVSLLGVVLQHEPAPSLHVHEVLALASPSAQALEALLVEHRLEALRDRPLNELSGGERQRVAIARAAAGKPALYLLDEPSNHLDLVERRLFLEWLERVRSEAAIVLAAHDAHILGRADRGLRLADGRAHEGKPADLIGQLE
jgi:ABC-type cobalamin/Fe3+-siderophores transport system ATPase subunit